MRPYLSFLLLLLASPVLTASVLIDPEDQGSALEPQIATSTDGSAIVVWYQYDGVTYDIWARRYQSLGGWGAPQKIENGTGYALRPRVAIDPAGNAVAVWEQLEGQRYNIWANHFRPTTGWSAAQRIETDDVGSAADPQVAMDGSGRATAVWAHSDGTRSNILANRFVGGAWGTPQLLEVGPGNAQRPKIAVNATGDAMAVWTQLDGTRINIRSNVFSPAAGWATSVLVERNDLGDAGEPQVAIDGRGNARAVWRQNEGVRRDIFTAQYRGTAGWNIPERVEQRLEPASEPRIVMNEGGEALIVWVQSDGGPGNRIWANHSSTGQWDGPVVVDAEYSPHVSMPQLDIDDNGVAYVIWKQNHGTPNSIRAKRFSSTCGWTSATNVGTDAFGTTDNPHLAIDSSGNAIAVWQIYQDTGTFYVSNILAEHDVASTSGSARLDTEGLVSLPSVAVNDTGVGMAVWTDDDTEVSLRWNRHVRGCGWSGPAVLPTVGVPAEAKVVVDNDGNAIAAIRSSGSIWASRNTKGSGWSVPVLLETTAGVVTQLALAVDHKGNVIAVWEQGFGAEYGVWANRYVPNVGWGTEVLLQSTPTVSHSPSIEFDAAGNAVAVWSRISPNLVWSARYVTGSGWTQATPISNTSPHVGASQVSVASDGSAMAPWIQSDGTFFGGWVNRFSPGVGWLTPQFIGTSPGIPSSAPRVDHDDKGNAMAVWTQGTGSQIEVWARLYETAAGWGSPTMLQPAPGGATPQIGVDESGNALAVWVRRSDGRVGSRRYHPVGGWTASAIFGDTENSSSPALAMSADGHSIAVWLVFDNLWARVD